MIQELSNQQQLFKRDFNIKYLPASLIHCSEIIFILIKYKYIHLKNYMVDSFLLLIRCLLGLANIKKEIL